MQEYRRVPIFSDIDEVFLASDTDPKWMTGRTPPRPFIFQFDVTKTAKGMGSISNALTVDFDRVPF